MKKRFTLISEKNLRNLIRRELLKEEAKSRYKTEKDLIAAIDYVKSKKGFVAGDKVWLWNEEAGDWNVGVVKSPGKDLKFYFVVGQGDKRFPAQEVRQMQLVDDPRGEDGDDNRFTGARRDKPTFRPGGKTRTAAAAAWVMRTQVDPGTTFNADMPKEILSDVSDAYAAGQLGDVDRVIKLLDSLRQISKKRAFKAGWEKWFKNIGDRKGRATAEQRVKLVKTWIKSPPEGSDEKYGSFVEWYNKWVAIRKQQGEGSGHFGTRVALKLLADPAFASKERGKLGAGPEKTKEPESAEAREERSAAGKAAGKEAHRASMISHEGKVWHRKNDKNWEYSQIGGEREEGVEVPGVGPSQGKWIPGKWHTRKKGKTKWINLEARSKFKSTVDKLNDELKAGKLMVV